MLGSNAMIEGAVVLKRFEWSARMLCIVSVVVDNLNLESIRRGMATDGCSQRDAVVSGRGQFEFDSKTEVFVFIFA